ncbi:DUF4259 domain-containing protein [Nonomuraea sp. NPDC049158]|uniref:DUF4259 domain-containing protein n=1 Tax=Nonomuraea sp. NPDC049158 TaxID=3155649 RepID=UPI0033C09A53
MTGCAAATCRGPSGRPRSSRRWRAPDGRPPGRALAVRALDRVMGEDSEWLALWEESGSSLEAVTVIEGIRGAL